MKRARTVGLWIVTLLVAAPMVGPGVQKFTSPIWQRMFRVWGYPEHFYLVIGAIEVVAGHRPAGAAHRQRLRDHADGRHGRRGRHAVTHGRNGVGELVFMTMLGIVAYADGRVCCAAAGVRPAPFAVGATPVIQRRACAAAG